VRQPEVAEMVPGNVVPVKVPSNGDVADGPLYRYIKSKLFSNSKVVKEMLTHIPGTSEQIVSV